MLCGVCSWGEQLNKNPIDSYTHSLWFIEPGGRQHATVVASTGKARESARTEREKKERKEKETWGRIRKTQWRHWSKCWSAGRLDRSVRQSSTPSRWRLLRVQAGFQTQALLQLAGGGGPW